MLIYVIIAGKETNSMKYNILASADYHWGAMDADKQYEESAFIINYLKSHDIDLYVICGDYFDHRLLMNSKSAFNSIRLIDEIKTLSKEKNFKIVIFDGTESHDYDQLEIFRTFEDENFKIFRKNTIDETLPGLVCMYCPDENIRTDDYINTYRDNIFRTDIDIMFFHGTFDSIMINRSLDDDIPNVIYEYAFYSNHCKLMVGGHWHNGDNTGNMYYTRSPYRWKYDEDLPKGIIHIEYDTDKKTYSIDRIENTATDRYFTFHVDTTLYYDISQYSNLLRSVDEKLNDGVEHVRIKVEITEDKDLNKSCIDNLVNKFQGNRRVKVDIENKYVKKLKKERTKELNVFKDKYKYIFDNDSTLPDIFKQFIFDTKGIDVPEEEIAAVLNDLKIERV